MIRVNGEIRIGSRVIFDGHADIISQALGTAVVTMDGTADQPGMLTDGAPTSFIIDVTGTAVVE